MFRLRNFHQVQSFRKCISCTKRHFSNNNSTTPKNNTGGIIFFSAICITAAGLGTWQMQRYQWKVDLIEELKARSQAPPIEATSVDEMVHAQTGRRLHLKGKFEHDREFLLGLRSPPASLQPHAQGMATNPQGYYVITPLLLETNERIFVNRGWVPRNATSWTKPNGLVSFDAVLVSTEQPNKFSPKNEPKSKKMIWLEAEKMVEAASLEGLLNEVVIVDVVDRKQDTPTYPFPKSADSGASDYYVQPVNHLSYAFTWYSLSLIGCYMTYLRFRKKRPIVPNYPMKPSNGAF